MTYPPPPRRISLPKDAPATYSERMEIADYLATIKHDDDLFMRCIRKAVKKLRRYDLVDYIWLGHWLPIIERDLNATQN